MGKSIAHATRAREGQSHEGSSLKYTVVLNSRSGTAASEDEVRAAFRAFGAECEIVPLSSTPNSRLDEVARRCDVLVAAGGDGTANTAAHVLVRSGSGAQLGLLPLGTANDLARSLDIPADLSESVEVLVTGQAAPLDVARVDEDRVMVNQANGGFGGTVAQELEEETKSRWGPLGYWRASVDVVQELPEYDVELVLDGERLSARALNMTVANGRYSGGGVPLAPEAEYADGLLDIVIVEGRGALGLLPLLPRVLVGRHLDAGGVIYRRAREVEFFSRPPMPFSVDGELSEEHPRMPEVQMPRKFEVLPGRLRVRVRG